jgi:hypothetical protein
MNHYIFSQSFWVAHQGFEPFAWGEELPLCAADVQLGAAWRGMLYGDALYSGWNPKTR